jgi:hypothetical protein
MDRYVCVRIPMANTLDLTRFQFDFDQSFAAFLMHPDGTIYARFGTRSERPEEEDISLEGLRKALAAALEMYQRHDQIKPSLAGKQSRPGRFRLPTDYPALAGKYKDRLDYDGTVVQSCLHCHQIRDAERELFRGRSEPIPDEVLFPYPDPRVVGLVMDPKEMATIKQVSPGSPAERAGLRAGDQIQALAGQPLLSIADLQWVLHNAPDPARLEAEVVRDGQARKLTLNLPGGWRRHGDISWRVSTWNLRRLGLGGMLLQDLPDEERRAAGLGTDTLALRAQHVGQYGDHAIAKQAGFVAGDLIVGVDGRDRRMTETELLAYALQRKRPGETLRLNVLRDGQRRELRITLPRP